MGLLKKPVSREDDMEGYAAADTRIRRYGCPSIPRRRPQNLILSRRASAVSKDGGARISFFDRLGTGPFDTRLRRYSG